MAFWSLAKRRRRNPSFIASSTRCLSVFASKIAEEQAQMNEALSRSHSISLSRFTFNFNSFNDSECVLYFCFNKANVTRMVDAISRPNTQSHTDRSRCAVYPILATCVILRRLSTPLIWKEIEHLFGKHASQLSEIFCKALEHFLEARMGLITGEIRSSFLQTRVEMHADAIKEKTDGLPNCAGFIDGTFIGIARPTAYETQMVAYNGHKRKHFLKFQVVNSPDGLIFHAYGSTEGRKHDRTIYVRSGFDEQLPNLLDIRRKRFCNCIYGDSG